MIPTMRDLTGPGWDRIAVTTRDGRTLEGHPGGYTERALWVEAFGLKRDESIPWSEIVKIEVERRRRRR